MLTRNLSQKSDDLSLDAAELDFLLSQMKEIMVEHLKASRDPEALVVNFKPPEELMGLMDLDLPYKGLGLKGLIPLLRNILLYSVNTWNPRFLDKLYAGTNPVGIISEMLISLLNANSHVYNVSPVLTLMEYRVSEKLGKLLGMGEKCGGITCPGGSFSNQLAMITARNHLFPEIKTKGYCAFGKRLTVFTSSAAHYSIQKTAMALGLGSENVIIVSCDEEGRMKTDELGMLISFFCTSLRRLINMSIERCETPFFINATAGTTVLGAIDPLRRIGKIAKRYKIWFHVDGSWGGNLIFSERRRHWLDGSQLADSFTLNPHKMLGVPLQCSFLLAYDRDIFTKSNALGAGYLFHGNKYDLGDGTVGCGRRPDAVKLFIGWKIYGIEGYSERIEYAFSMAGYLTSLVKKNPRFRLVISPPTLQICFWYIPKNFSTELEHTDYTAFSRRLSVVTKGIHRLISQEGKFMIDYAPLTLDCREIPVFFRVVVNAPTINEGHLDELVEMIERKGETGMEWIEHKETEIPIYDFSCPNSKVSSNVLNGAGLHVNRNVSVVGNNVF
ncbi:hypothetical protein G9A89_020776 [Geosiphon pyriformis]|nr:hypothetical protein G9A89_020776 [Geosiphon pyriformis]